MPDNGVRLVRPTFAVTAQAVNGWRAVVLVNERGQLLHTEAVCTFPDSWHPWFGPWLAAQACPILLPDVRPE